MSFGRRAFTTMTAAAVLGGRALPLEAKTTDQPTSTKFEIVRLEAKHPLAKDAALLVPKSAAGRSVPLVVLLHGKGESTDPSLGVIAWTRLYGLASSYERLLAPPIAPTGKRGEWTDARLDVVNASLHARVYGAPAILCPFTPNLLAMDGRTARLATYASWIVDDLIPLVRRHVTIDDAHIGINGCSMGGPIAWATYLHRPATFSKVGMVQGAIGEHTAEALATSMADHFAKATTKATTKPSIHLITSTGDAFLKGNRALDKALTAKKIVHGFREIPGPHDQPWLREAGTIEALLFHDRG